MAPESDVSRRRFMKHSVGVAAAVPLLAGISAGDAGAAANHRIAATVVRAGPSKLSAGMLRVGVRATIMTPDIVAEDVVFVVDPIAFGAPAAEPSRQIGAGVRDQVSAWLSDRGMAVDQQDVAVQVFGVHS